MAEETSVKGIWNGWYWRLVGATVGALLALQVIAYYTVAYPITTSQVLAEMMVIYVVAPRVRERRFGNTVAGVILVFLLGLLLQLVLPVPPGSRAGAGAPDPRTAAFWELELVALVTGVVLTYLFLRLSAWSDRKRAELEAKRRAEQSPPPQRHRHHSKKKKRKRR
ncbi:MAG: hypothetical protein IRZ33_05080 [Alicyclobacillaceae bacterium]|nr:hypothetical protein [Alicyclobacillaceae bacterium]